MNDIKRRMDRSFPRIPILMAALASLQSSESGGRVKIPSHVIEPKHEEQEPSKRRLQRAKGKRARKNRGNNRR